ncbi:hypothetical protein COO60DRAFT_1627913 [Scenedesmus sp. NREL 46B-D3]|nr:hypothetical protein COO60DRAFT_1627913 [Scenedesmus sp. NREL 46B-D3]
MSDHLLLLGRALPPVPFACRTLALMLLVPQVDGDARDSGSTRCLLWAYFFVYRFESFAERMYMQQHQSIAPLQLPDVQRALKARRTQDRAWQSCIEYQQQNPLLGSGLPAWAEWRGITLHPHLSKAVPYCQLDLVDRCYMQRSDEDSAAGGRGNSGGGGGGPDGDARSADACGSGYAAAGADQLLPLRVGSYEQFVAPCSCPKGSGQTEDSDEALDIRPHDRLPSKRYFDCVAGGIDDSEEMHAGSLVAEYCGELVPVKECRAREDAYQAAGLFYISCEEGDHALPPELVPPPRKYMIDATFAGGVARFANHSCDPNCKIVKVCSGKSRQGEPLLSEHISRTHVCNGKSQQGEPLLLALLETLRDVRAGEELTFDYKPSSKPWKAAGKPQGLLDCKCGAANCSSVMPDTQAVEQQQNDSQSTHDGMHSAAWKPSWKLQRLVLQAAKQSNVCENQHDGSSAGEGGVVFPY